MAKRALLMGINRYQIPGSDLRGCVNDVKDLQAALVGACGFKKADITVLTDAAASKKAMQAGITALIRASKKGDIALLHYSGHGSNVPDDNGDESDGRDEILCPANLDWDDPLRDDWLRTTLDGLRDGVALTVIMDCCHSGTNTRAVLPPDAPVKERYLPSPAVLWATETGRGLRRAVSTELRRSARGARRRSDIVDADLAEVLITGCRDTQTSADAFINGRYNGALTFALVDAITSSKGQLSYRDLHAKVSRTLQQRKFDQVPQLEGRKARFDQPVFSV